MSGDDGRAREKDRMREYLSEEDLIKTNTEMRLLRKELVDAYTPILIHMFEKKDIDNCLAYFHAMPTDLRKGRTSLEVIIECCRVAETWRKELNEKRD